MCTISVSHESVHTSRLSSILLAMPLSMGGIICSVVVDRNVNRDDALVHLCTIVPVDFVTVVIFWIMGRSNHYTGNTLVSPYSIRLR